MNSLETSVGGAGRYLFERIAERKSRFSAHR